MSKFDDIYLDLCEKIIKEGGLDIYVTNKERNFENGK